ncbi:hypothetical protein LSAT2_004052 [Lamellibrachia satsuma]|nr:hypothetical protein LSAT2_004052 [Lamellibrachia satsuma]
MLTSKVIAWIILVVLSSTLPARGTKPYSQYCVEYCTMMFFHCITKKCPTKTWPLPVPQHCLDGRLVCIEKCIVTKPLDYI